MISLWRHDDVIFEKSVKQQTLSTQILISIDSVLQINIFLVHVTNIAYFPNLSTKKIYWEDS